MIEVKFKTQIPNAVRDWINNKQFVEPLNEAIIRLTRCFSIIEEFKYNGAVLEVVHDERQQMIATCIIRLKVDDEKEARSLFSSEFNYVAKKGQKFKFLSFEKIVLHD